MDGIEGSNIRLECLRLAVGIAVTGSPHDEILVAARAFEAFAVNAEDKPTAPPLAAAA